VRLLAKIEKYSIVFHQVMTKPRYELSSQLSFRTYADRAVVIDHTDGTILEVNESAGRVLDLLDRGEQLDDDDDIEFAEVLVEEDLASRGERDSAATERASGPAARSSGESDLLEEINRWAAADLIPLHCQLELTYRCPLDCRHCYLAGTPTGEGRELSTAEITGFVDQLAELGGLFLLLTGGEPFVRRDLEPIVGHARDRRFAVSLITSGTGVRPALAERLAARGLDAVQVSIYGADAATHDRLTRVPGSFDAALGCLRLFRDLGVATRAGVTVTSENAAQLARIRELLEREGVEGAPGLYLEPRRDGSRAPQELTADEPGLRAALELFSAAGDHRMARVGSDDPVCGAGANALALDPFGTVRPCLPMRTDCGSIRESSLAEIWSSSPALAKLRAIRLRDLGECAACQDREWCDRCGAFAVAEGLAVTDHAPFDCLQARIARSLEGDH
jgi:radical SAM protein with 4Fe4S-binding SPASM domain